MADPLITATAINVGGQIIGGLFGNQSEESGMTLPPTLQLEMLRGSKQAFEMIQRNIADVDDLIASYDQRIQLIQEGIENTIPESQMLEQLTNNSAQIALKLGADAQDLIDNGFLDSEDIDRIKQLDEISSQNFRDEAFEQDYEKQKMALKQELRRQGVTGSAYEMTLNKWEADKSVERQQRTEILRQGSFNRGLQTLQAQSALRQQGYGNVLQGFGAQQQILGNAQQQFGNLANIAGQQVQMGFAGMNQQANLAGVRQNLFNSLGQFKLSENMSQQAISGNTQNWNYLMQTLDKGPFPSLTKRVFENMDAKGKLNWGNK